MFVAKLSCREICRGILGDSRSLRTRPSIMMRTLTTVPMDATCLTAAAIRLIGCTTTTLGSCQARLLRRETFGHELSDSINISPLPRENTSKLRIYHGLLLGYEL